MIYQNTRKVPTAPDPWISGVLEAGSGFWSTKQALKPHTFWNEVDINEWSHQFKRASYCHRLTARVCILTALK